MGSLKMMHLAIFFGWRHKPIPKIKSQLLVCGPATTMNFFVSAGISLMIALPKLSPLVEPAGLWPENAAFMARTDLERLRLLGVGPANLDSITMDKSKQEEELEQAITALV